MDKTYRIRLLTLQKLKDNIKNHYLLPISTNYGLVVRSTYGIRMYIGYSDSTFHKTHFLVCDHIRIINPDHNCWLEFTESQLHELLSEEDFNTYVKID